jgi:hypothetical protein
MLNWTNEGESIQGIKIISGAQANKHDSALEFELGEIYCKLQPYKLKSLAKRSNANLSLFFMAGIKWLRD